MNRQDMIDRHQDINVYDGDWADDIIREWVEKLAALGIEVSSTTHTTTKGRKYETPDVHWSGFCSQGDGACFEGYVNLPMFINEHDLDYPYIVMASSMGRDVSCKLTHSGRYSHENSISYNLEVEPADLPYYNDEGTEIDIRYAVLHNLWAQFDLNEGYAALEADIKSICQDYMKEIYHELEAQYEYLTSDDTVWDTLEANDMSYEELT